MRTVQMTLDDELVEAVDRVAKQLKINRSAFTRKALQQALAHHDVLQMEKQHRAGYRKKPVSQNEFSVWEEEQEWGDL